MLLQLEGSWGSSRPLTGLAGGHLGCGPECARDLRMWLGFFAAEPVFPGTRVYEQQSE